MNYNSKLMWTMKSSPSMLTNKPAQIFALLQGMPIITAAHSYIDCYGNYKVLFYAHVLYRRTF